MISKAKKRKGFTLVEMMAVVAVIALLVAIIMPFASRSTTRSNAAANAANLRELKAQVSIMMLQGQISHDNAQSSDAVVADIDQMIADANSAGDTGLAGLLTVGKYAIMALDYFDEVGSRWNNTYYGTSDGTIEIDGVTLTAPTAKAINLGKKMNLRKGTPVTVTVGANDIVVTYGGVNIETLAIIAEHGDAADVDMKTIKHSYIDSNSDSECDICGTAPFTGIHSDKSDWVGDIGDNIMGGAHSCTDTTPFDHVCDNPDCGLPVRNNHSDGDDDDKICDAEGCEEKVGGGCVTPDTLVTLADGSKKRIDEITYADELLVWDFYNGEYTTAPSSIIFNHGYDMNTVIGLTFSDGTGVEVVTGHRFFDMDANEFVYINAETVAGYVGHNFVKMDGVSRSTVELVDYTVEERYEGSYSLMSAYHYNFIVADLLSNTFMIQDNPLFTYFEIGENMTYDQNAMGRDIETYGLYDYSEFENYLTYEQFVAFNVPCMKVSVGKGNFTYEGILNLIATYVEG